MFEVSVPRSLLALAVGIAACLSVPAASIAQEGSSDAARICGAYAAPAVPDLAPVAAADGTARATSPFGEVEVPSAPARALGMYTTDVDILIWLGYPLAASQPIRGVNGYETFPCFFPQQALVGITPFGNYPEYNYERILAVDPDFILNGLGYDEAVNTRLPQIAPTFSVNAFDGRPWQEHFRETAEALGRLDRYEAWVALYQQRVAEVRAAIAGRGDVVVAPLAFWDGKFNSGCYVGVQCSVFHDLGLTIFAGALDNDGNGVELSPEDVGQFKEIDYAFTTIGAGDEGIAGHRAWMAEAARNPLWAQLPMVTAGHIVPFDMEMVYGSPSGQLAFLEVVASILSQ